MAAALSILLLLLLASSSSYSHASACESCLRQGKAAYAPSAAVATGGGGVCGYGAMDVETSEGFLATGGPRQHRGGLGCGRCFQMRCRDAKVCSSRGVRVVLTDFHRSNSADFMLGGSAFAGLAKPGTAQQLRRLGPLSIEYKRIPCDYNDKNLSILVEKQSEKPSKLVIKFLYQGGQTDILAVDVAQVGSLEWRFMNQVHGPVWSTDRAPTGPLQFRAVVTAGTTASGFGLTKRSSRPTGSRAMSTTPVPGLPMWRGRAS